MNAEDHHTMSDSDKPDLPPEPAPQSSGPAEQPAPPPPPAAAPTPPAPEKKPSWRERLRPGREKPERNPTNAGAVPSLEHEQTYGLGKKIDVFDEDVERELQEAMGGL